MSLAQIGAGTPLGDRLDSELLGSREDRPAHPRSEFRVAQTGGFRERANDEGHAARHGNQQLPRDRPESSTQTVPDNGNTHPLRDDESESSGCRCVSVQLGEDHQATCTDPLTPARDATEVIASSDPVRLG